ncbi:ice-binding family protein [Ornithinimicrobium pratense]|uniref:ice-binding family protein n=1 Tax=Ornithinimicrobium pratense TaxID=2593973 RepID=UPI001EE29F72|nr:ice-binding family protein [Ornithinimicrobium pratense]
MALALVVGAGVGPVAALDRVGLGTASNYAVLGGSTVTNTGPSVINGYLGVAPGTAITGFPPGLVNGEVHAADAEAGVAKADLTTAYNDAAGRATDVTISADLAGQTLTPGVYTGDTLALNGQLTLDGANETDPVFIFQSASTLITGSSSSIVFMNGANACDVYWQVGSSATIGTTTAFAGTVMAHTSITANTGATVQGRLLASGGAVTLDSNTITVPACAPTGPEPTEPEPTQPEPPEPTEPEPTEPEPTEPEPTEPEPTQPEPPEPTQPEPTQPEPTQPEPTQPEPTQPEPTQPEPTQPEPTQPEPTQPEPTQPEPTQPEPTQPEPTQPEPTQPEPTQPEPTQPEPTQPEPTQPEPTQPEPTQPEPTQPEPTQPEPTQPEPTQPEPTQPEPTQPEPTQPQPTQPTQPQPTQPVDGQVKTWPVGGVQTGGEPAGSGARALLLMLGGLAMAVGLGGLVWPRSAAAAQSG